MPSSNWSFGNSSMFVGLSCRCLYCPATEIVHIAARLKYFYHTQAHKRETETWLALRLAEIEQAKLAIATEKATLQRNNAQLKADQAKLAADTESLEAKV